MMRTTLFILFLLLGLVGGGHVTAQSDFLLNDEAQLRPAPPEAKALEATSSVTFFRRNLGGPRFGFTVVSGHGKLVEELENQDMGRTLSQFGWHFERQVIPEGGGPQFVVEFVPMLAGVEYGKFIPNLTLAMGVRTPSGIEFGMGPNVFFSRTLDDETEVPSSLLLAVGKSLSYGGVSVPLNLAYTTNPTAPASASSWDTPSDPDRA